jgi:hypothetical protein
VVLGGPNCTLRCVGSMVMGWDQLIFNAFPDKVVFQELGALIVKAVEFGLAASFGEGDNNNSKISSLMTTGPKDLLICCEIHNHCWVMLEFKYFRTRNKIKKEGKSPIVLQESPATEGGLGV